MMDYLAAFEISSTGMNIERLRLDTTALNIANAHTTRSADGTLFKPMRVVATPRFSLIDTGGAYQAAGVQVAEVKASDQAPRMVFDPGHPDADEKGFVAYPDINPVAETVRLITATRAYEANVRALNAAKTMALKALEIGGG